MEETSLDPKIKNNAISAYLLVFLSVWFLFNKTNKYVDNDFVKSHTKTAFFIHLLFLLVYVIFVILIPAYTVTVYVAAILFLWVFGLLLYGIYKAWKWQTFKIIDIVKISKVEKMADLHRHLESDENSKFSFFLSYIPFVSYANYSLLNSNTNYNKVFKNNIYINLIISLLISIIYINWNSTLAIFILLFYIIIIVFITLILIAQDNFIFVYINHINKVEQLELYLKTFAEYFKNYTKTSLVPYKELIASNIAKELAQESSDELMLNTKKDSKLPKYLIYIPIINLIYLFSLDTKYRFHIINWLSLTIITIFMLYIYWWFSGIFFLLLYPVCFWIWNLRWKMAYKQTFIFHIYNSFILIQNKLAKMIKKIKETKNTVKKTDYKIEWEIETWAKKVMEVVKEWEVVEKKKEEVKVESPVKTETK